MHNNLTGAIDVTDIYLRTGFGRWTKYALRIQDDSVEKPAFRSGEEKILAYVNKHDTINNSECRKMLGINEKQAWYLLSKLSDSGTLKRQAACTVSFREKA